MRRKETKIRNTFGLALLAGAMLMFSAPAFGAGDMERGKILFNKCVGCHQVGEGAVNRIGPQLNGIFDRPAGTVEGFRYSNGMKRASADGLVWTLAKLDAFIEDPRILVSRTRMSFRGMKDAQDRTDLLAYLQQYSWPLWGTRLTGNICRGNVLGAIRPVVPMMAYRPLPTGRLKIL